MTPASKAWTALGIGIVIYELAAPPGQLLSEGVDRGIEKHPHLTRLGITLVALHLINGLPPRFDPLHRFWAVPVGLRQRWRENRSALATAAAIGVAVEVGTHHVA